MSDLEKMDAHEISAAYAAGTLSPVEIIKDVLARIDRINPILNAFTLVDHDAALRDARASEKRWHTRTPLSPWDGIPATVKDLIATKRWTPSFGSHVISAPLSGEDGPAAARLREAGCVLLGMTTSPEIGWKGVTDSPRFGITRNAWNPGKTPGGSSGGAAVAAALNLGHFHIGTDGGGSIRMPAAFSGIFGIKATFGRVPAYPPSIMGSLAHVGPMTRTVRDATAMLNILSRRDARDWYAAPELPEITLSQTDDLEPLKIAYSPDLGHMSVDPEVAQAVADAATLLDQLGARVNDVSLEFVQAQCTFETLWFGAARHRLSCLSPLERTRLDQNLVQATDSVASLGADDHIKAALRRAEIGFQAERLLNDWDVLITPAVPFPAFEAGLETPDGAGRWTDWAAFNYPFNLSQQPACSVPCGFTKSGLPIGLQIIARKYRDDLVLRVAAAYQAANPVAWPTTSPIMQAAE